MAEQLGLPKPQAGWQLIADITRMASPPTLVLDGWTTRFRSTSTRSRRNCWSRSSRWRACYSRPGNRIFCGASLPSPKEHASSSWPRFSGLMYRSSISTTTRTPRTTSNSTWRGGCAPKVVARCQCTSSPPSWPGSDSTRPPWRRLPARRPSTPSACSPGTLIIERVWWTVNRTGPRDWLSLTPAQINVAVEWITAPAWRQSKSLSRRMKGNCWRTGSERGTGRNPRARRGGVVAERQRVTAEIAELISRAPEHAR